jgi:hypothetical protein
MSFKPTKKWLESGRTAEEYNDAVQKLRDNPETAAMNRRWMSQNGVKDQHVFGGKPGA